MMRAKFILVFAVLLGYGMFSFTVRNQQDDLFDTIASSLKSSNSTRLSKYFADHIETGILSDERLYSKAQLKPIMDDFLSKHQVSSVKIIHRVESKPTHKLFIALMETNNGQFRATIIMNNVASRRLLITDMHIRKSN